MTAAPPTSRFYFLTIVAFGLIAVGLLRIALIVFHEPVLGYGDHSPLLPWRTFGTVYLLLFGAVAVVTAAALRMHPWASVIHGTLFFLLIADPVATLWFNTLETEPIALLGTYGAAAMCAVILFDAGGRRWPWWMLGASLVVLGCSRQQFAFLPLVLAALAAPALARRSTRAAWILVGVAALTAVLQLAMGPLGRTSLGSADPVSAYPGAPLAPAADEEQTSLSEPLTFVRRASKVLPATEAMVPGYLRIAGTGRIRTVADLPPWKMSLVALLARTHVMVYSTIVMALLISFPVAIGWLVWSARRSPAGELVLPTIYAMLVGIAAYSLASIAVGEGAAGAERRHWLGSVASLAAVVLIPFIFRHATQDFFRGRVALVAAIGVVLLAGCWTAWTYHRGMAIGVMEKMSEGSKRSLEVSGWALDPWRVRRVYAIVGGGYPADGQRGMARRDLETIYPGYPDAANGGFQISIPAGKWRENELMRIYVENSGGGLTEIDRRKVVLPAAGGPAR